MEQTLQVKGPERTCGGCGLPVIFAQSPNGTISVLHKNPPCEGFERFKHDPMRLMKFIETGNSDEAAKMRAPNRHERRRWLAVNKKRQRAVVPQAPPQRT